MKKQIISSLKKLILEHPYYSDGQKAFQLKNLKEGRVVTLEFSLEDLCRAEGFDYPIEPILPSPYWSDAP